MEKYLVVLFYGWLAAFTIMSILWLIGKMIKNYAIVDVGWGLSIFSIAITYCIFGDGNFEHKILITALVGIWGLRLSLYLLFTRIINGHEDKRYVAFRNDYGDKVDRKFFINVFQLQAILGVLLSSPFLLANMNANPEIQMTEMLAIFIFFAGFLGESIADYQLNKFKSNKANVGLVCDVGLWRYTRHPNYFFEWVIWISFSLAAVAAPYGWIGILSPVIMYILLTRISGVRLTEKYSIKSKGRLYLNYQRSTNSFFPWFKRELTK